MPKTDKAPPAWWKHIDLDEADAEVACDLWVLKAAYPDGDGSRVLAKCIGYNDDARWRIIGYGTPSDGVRITLDTYEGGLVRDAAMRYAQDKYGMTGPVVVLPDEYEDFERVYAQQAADNAKLRRELARAIWNPVGFCRNCRRHHTDGHAIGCYYRDNPLTRDIQPYRETS